MPLRKIIAMDVGGESEVLVEVISVGELFWIREQVPALLMS